MDFQDLPIATQTAAMRLLREAERNVNACGDSGIADGYWVESHTLGCRDEGGDTDLWAAHWEFWDKYSSDGMSILIGDPTTGAFVSITPTKALWAKMKPQMGAEMLIELGRRAKKTVPLSVGDEIAELVATPLRPISDAVVVAGSVRRRRPEIGDVELVVLPKDLAELKKRLAAFKFTGGDRIQKGQAHTGPYKHSKAVPVEIYIAHKPEEMGAMLFMYTGDFQHNIAMRSIAKRQGWKLDQYGLWDAKTGEKILQSPDEREFYDALGVDWHWPEERSFKDRSKKRASMGAEMLIELGGAKRKVGYIHLELLSPEEDGADTWVLKVERVDPFGGEPWKGEFQFEDEAAARYWFEKGVIGDEDIDTLIRQTG